MHHNLLTRKKMYWFVISVAICVGLVVYIVTTTEDDTIVSPALATPKVPVQVDSTAVSIEPSLPKRIFIPSRNKDLVISTTVRPMPSNCRQVIDPPRTGPTVGDIFACRDLDLPGTESGVSVLAGHSSLHLTTWLNRLYKQGSQLLGREIMIQTTESGDKRLVYQVRRVYRPSNKKLPYMTDIWGMPDEPVAPTVLLW